MCFAGCCAASFVEVNSRQNFPAWDGPDSSMHGVLIIMWRFLVESDRHVHGFRGRFSRSEGPLGTPGRSSRTCRRSVFQEVAMPALGGDFDHSIGLDPDDDDRGVKARGWNHFELGAEKTSGLLAVWVGVDSRQRDKIVAVQSGQVAMSRSQVEVVADSRRRDDVAVLQNELVAEPKSQVGGTRAGDVGVFEISSACIEKALKVHGFAFSIVTEFGFVSIHGVEMLASAGSRGSRRGVDVEILHRSRQENVTKLQHQQHGQSGTDVGVDGLSCGPRHELPNIDPSMHRSEDDSGRCRVFPVSSFFFHLFSRVFWFLCRRRLGPAPFCLYDLRLAPWVAFQMAIQGINYACRPSVVLL